MTHVKVLFPLYSSIQILFSRNIPLYDDFVFLSRSFVTKTLKTERFQMLTTKTPEAQERRKGRGRISV